MSITNIFTRESLLSLYIKYLYITFNYYLFSKVWRVTTKLTEQQSSFLPNRPLQSLPGDGSQNNLQLYWAFHWTLQQNYKQIINDLDEKTQNIEILIFLIDIYKYCHRVIPF